MNQSQGKIAMNKLFKGIALGTMLAVTPLHAERNKDIAQLITLIKADKATERIGDFYDGKKRVNEYILKKIIEGNEYRIAFAVPKRERSTLDISIFKDGMLLETYQDKGLDGVVEYHIDHGTVKVVEVEDDSNKPHISTYGNNREESNKKFLETIKKITEEYQKKN